jgi:hypothetical protein
MSQWGLFRDDDEVLHVAPILPDGRLPVNHALHEFCPCGPRAEQQGSLIIWVHQDEERGGCTA